MIEYPLASHRFRVFVDQYEKITQQLTECNINLVNNTLSISVIQPATDNGLFTEISSVCQTISNQVIIEFTSGSNPDTVLSSLIFDTCKVEKHELLLNYGNTDVCKHKLIIKFKQHYMR